MTTTIHLRRGTAAQWASQNPILLSGEPGYSTDTKILKVGDGTHHWADLSSFLTDSLTVNQWGGIAVGTGFDGDTLEYTGGIELFFESISDHINNWRIQKTDEGGLSFEYNNPDGVWEQVAYWMENDLEFYQNAVFRQYLSAFKGLHIVTDDSVEGNASVEQKALTFAYEVSQPEWRIRASDEGMLITDAYNHDTGDWDFVSILGSPNNSFLNRGQRVAGSIDAGRGVLIRNPDDIDASTQSSLFGLRFSHGDEIPQMRMFQSEDGWVWQGWNEAVSGWEAIMLAYPGYDTTRPSFTFEGTVLATSFAVSMLTLGSSGAITPNMEFGMAKMVLTGAAAIAIPHDTAGNTMATGREITLVIGQDGVGGRVATLNAGYRLATGTVLPTAPNTANVITFICDGSHWLQKSIALGVPTS